MQLKSGRMIGVVVVKGLDVVSGILDEKMSQLPTLAWEMQSF